MSLERGFRRIVAVLSLAALACGLVFTVALVVASVHAERYVESSQRAAERVYAESCLGGVDNGAAKHLAFTPLEGGALGPYRWRVEIPSPQVEPLWKAQPQPRCDLGGPEARGRDRLLGTERAVCFRRL